MPKLNSASQLNKVIVIKNKLLIKLTEKRSCTVKQWLFASVVHRSQTHPLFNFSVV